ncbi:MAG: acyltransferase [Acidimicrobiales bacterium]
MRPIWAVLGFFRVGRIRDWYRFTYARLRSGGRVTAASTPHIDRPFTLRMSPRARLVLGHNVHFRPGFSADIEGDGVLEIGDHSAFNVNCWIGVTTRVSIGRACLIGPHVTVTDGNHSFDQVDEPIWSQGLATRQVVVGDNVWIGAKATIIHSVGDGAVVGANAVVTHPVPANAVAVGVPARVQRLRGDVAPEGVPTGSSAVGGVHPELAGG